jgi:hypothetical protein
MKMLTRQLRIDAKLAKQIADLGQRTSLSESDIVRMAIRFGIERLESGECNPFVSETPKKPNPAQGAGDATAHTAVRYTSHHKTDR